MKMTGESLLYRAGVISSSLFYRDPPAAMAWLQRAFGLEPCHLVEDESGALTHIEMSLGESVVTIGGEWTHWAKSPADAGGANTQMLRVTIEGDLDALFARAVAAGATAVIHQHLPPPDFAQLLARETRHDVVAAARGRRDDHPYGLFRVCAPCRGEWKKRREDNREERRDS